MLPWIFLWQLLGESCFSFAKQDPVLELLWPQPLGLLVHKNDADKGEADAGDREGLQGLRSGLTEKSIVCGNAA
jgi:hypothetical protein